MASNTWWLTLCFPTVFKLHKAKQSKHIKTSPDPYHPTSNRATARFVETLKKAMTAKLSVSLSTKFQISYRITLHLTANIITVSNIQAWATNDEHQAIYTPEQHLLSIEQYITTHKEQHINVSNPCQAVSNIWKTSEAHNEQWAIYNKHKQNTRSSE